MNDVRTYQVELNGLSPLILHQDSVEWAEKMDDWKKDSENTKKGKAGDDRMPAWRWLGCLYYDSGKLVVPADNLQTLLREGGAKVPTGNGKKTFKAQSQSGICVNEVAWPLLVGGKEIQSKPFTDLEGESDFDQHHTVCKKHGFELFVKRARVQGSKHIRVRPRFMEWALRGTVLVLDDQITDKVLEDIFFNAGKYSGLGDWRASSPQSPGAYGRFQATIKKV